MIFCVACQCGSSDKLIRKRLEKYEYKDFLTIDIPKGKSKSFSKLNSVPQHPEINMLREHIKASTKYAVVVGVDDEKCRWVDLAVGNAVFNDSDLKMIIKHFA